MKLLAIDTSSTACSVALLLPEEIKSIHQIAPLQQAQLILGLIDEILQSASLRLDQLDALAFGCGPGSFTGVRIAASVIQGLSFAVGLPIIRISSLAALAQSAYQDLGWENILVGVDARIQEVYWGAYQLNSQKEMTLVGNEIVCPPEEVVLPTTGLWSGAGNAWSVYAKQIPYQPQTLDVTRLPNAAAVAYLAKSKYANQQWCPLAEAIPTYLRDNVAKKRSVD